MKLLSATFRSNDCHTPLFMGRLLYGSALLRLSDLQTSKGTGISVSCEPSWKRNRSSPSRGILCRQMSDIETEQNHVAVSSNFC